MFCIYQRIELLVTFTYILLCMTFLHVLFIISLVLFLFHFKFYSLRSVVAVLIITIHGEEAVEVEEDSQHRRGAK